MPEKIEALSIFLVLLPGFTCAYVAQYLAVRREQSELDKVIEALIFSFILYLLSWPIFGYSMPLEWSVAADGQLHILVHYAFLVVLFVLAIVLGIGYAANINHDWALALLRKFRITERTSRIAIWHDVFQETGGWVQVLMKDGKKALGWVRYYSDDIDDRSLFLERASWIAEDGTEKPIDGLGLFLTKDCEIEAIMFLGTGIEHGSSVPADRSSNLI